MGIFKVFFFFLNEAVEKDSDLKCENVNQEIHFLIHQKFITLEQNTLPSIKLGMQ